MSKRANPVGYFFPEMNLVSHSPRFQVIITNGVFELLINVLIEVLCKNTSAKRFNYGNKLVLLNEKGVIGDLQYNWLNAFRDLRNEAAHGQFVLTPKMLEPFKTLALPHKLSITDPKNFQHLCNGLFVGFWNTHLKIFNSYFDKLPTNTFPSLAATDKKPK